MKAGRFLAALSLVLMASTPVLAQATKATPQTTPGQAQQKPGSPQVATTPQSHTGLIDLNSASESQLDSLPGIGKKRASAIIKNRPYKSTDELVSRKVIPGKVYDGIKDQVTVR